MDMGWLKEQVDALGGYAEVARLTGLARAHLSNTVNGKVPLGKETAVKLARIMPGVAIELWWSALNADIKVR